MGTFFRCGASNSIPTFLEPLYGLALTAIRYMSIIYDCLNCTHYSSRRGLVAALSALGRKPRRCDSHLHHREDGRPVMPLVHVVRTCKFKKQAWPCHLAKAFANFSLCRGEGPRRQVYWHPRSGERSRREGA